jgi:hypothetical protein
MSETLRAWVAERLANCERIAATKTGADRDGWLEDAANFRELLSCVPLSIQSNSALPAEPQRTGSSSDADVATARSESGNQSDQGAPNPQGPGVGCWSRAEIVELIEKLTTIHISAFVAGERVSPEDARETRQFIYYTCISAHQFCDEVLESLDAKVSLPGVFNSATDCQVGTGCPYTHECGLHKRCLDGQREAIAKAVYEAWYTPMRWPDNLTPQSRDAGYRAADAVIAALEALAVHSQGRGS